MEDRISFVENVERSRNYDRRGIKWKKDIKVMQRKRSP
jgi:hypothetical protein